MTELFISDGKRYCLMCKKPIPDDMLEGIHPVPCQEEMNKYIIPEMLDMDFSQFFKRLTDCPIIPAQEQMYLLLENQENRYSFERCDGKTTLLIVYIIYKALHTPNNWGIVLFGDAMEQHANRLMKRMLLRLDFAEAVKLDIEPFQDINRDRHFRLPNTFRLDTFTPKELRNIPRLKHRDQKIFSKFNKFVSTIIGQRGQWTIIADPVFYPAPDPSPGTALLTWNHERAAWEIPHNRRRIFW